MTASVIRKVKGERKRLDLPWFTQKANKVPDTELALFTEAAGALSVGWGRRTPSSRWRHRAPSWLGLRSPGKKSEQRAPVLQVVILKEEQREKRREKEKKEWHGETKLWWSQVCSFIFKRSFYTLSYPFPEVKDIESCRVSSTLHQFDLHRDQDVFCITLYLQGSLCYAHYLLARRPIDILWPFSDKGWSTRKLAFP